MRRWSLPLSILLIALLLTGCVSTGADWAAASSFSPARAAAADRTPPPLAASPQQTSLPLAPDYAYASCGAGAVPKGEVYAGLVAGALPAPGAGLSFGQVWARTPTATWSFELDALLEDLGSAFCCDTSGTWAQLRGGVKATFNPCGRGHPTVRGGLCWLRATGRTDLVKEPGDYVAVYAGVGYEWDIGRGLTTGPEISATLAAQEKSVDLIVIPQARWHVIWRF